MERIAILCSGGDCQGMNACIKAFTNTCSSHGIIPIGINRGYQGLIENDFCFLDSEMVENIEFLGGTILKVSRSEEFRTEEGLDKAVRNLQKNKIEGLVIIGGNGSLTGALNLIQRGVNLIGIPGTIDNDLFYTDKSLGFDTAVSNAVEAIDNMMQTITANNRGMVVEVMGRGCGDIALYTALCVSAHSLATLEEETTINDIIKDVKKCMDMGVKSPLVITSENCPYDVKDVEKAIKKQLKIDTRSTELGYIQRGGAPSVYDRLLAIQFGILAVNLLKDNVSGMALGINDEKIFHMPLVDAMQAKQSYRKELHEMLRNMHNI